MGGFIMIVSYLMLLTTTLGQTITWGGKCKEDPLIKKFNLQKYAGLWYEQMRYPVRFQDDNSKCGTATYAAIDATTVSVNNTEISPIYMNRDTNQTQHQLTYILGKAKQTDPKKFPNKLNVSFDFGTKPMEDQFRKFFKDRKSNYNVMDTDFNNYSIVMNCRDYGFFTVEMGWILSRKQEFRATKQFKQIRDKAQKKFGFRVENAILSKQDPDDCEFDMVKYYP